MNKFRVMIEIEVDVSNFSGDTNDLPDRHEVMSAMRRLYAGELMNYKELDEAGLLSSSASVKAEIISIRESSE